MIMGMLGMHVENVCQYCTGAHFPSDICTHCIVTSHYTGVGFKMWQPVLAVESAEVSCIREFKLMSQKCCFFGERGRGKVTISIPILAVFHPDGGGFTDVFFLERMAEGF